MTVQQSTPTAPLRVRMIAGMPARNLGPVPQTSHLRDFQRHLMESGVDIRGIYYPAGNCPGVDERGHDLGGGEPAR